MSESEKRTSLTEQLRKLHLTLDPDAPHHATNAQRRDAIRNLINGLTGGDEDGQTTNRSAKGGAGTRTRTAGSTASRREARGVILPEAAEASKPTRKPAAGKPADKRNIDRLVDWLFGSGD